MTDMNKRIALSLGLIILLLGSAFLIPVIIASTEGNDTILLHHETDIVHTVRSPLTSTITNVNTSSNNSINVVLYNENTGDSVRITDLNETAQTTVTLSNEDITVVYEQFVTETNIIVTYEIPVYFNWPEGAQVIFNNISFVMVFTLILFIVGLILVMIGVFE